MSSVGPSIPARSQVSGRGLGVAAVHAAYVLAAFIALVWALFTIEWGVDWGVIGFDFRGTLWDPALAIREGRTPYPSPTSGELESGNPALYPPFLMFVVMPLTVLPWSAGVVVWTILLGGAIAAALYVLGVRDVRCYALALVAQFSVFGLIFGNATLLLVPLVALAWRWRERWVRVGVVVGLAIAAKLFLWPLLFWLLGTRRYRAFGAGVVACLVALFLPWALIGFDGLRAYPDLLRAAEDLYAAHGYSFAAILNALGTDIATASKVTLALGGALAAAAFLVGRRRADSAAVSLAVLAAVLGSPIVWPYYYALLLVPLAIVRPNFSGWWVALTLFYASNVLTRDLLTEEELAAESICCRPADVPFVIWSVNHSPPALWHASVYAVVGAALVAFAVWTAQRSKVTSEAA